MTTPPPTAESVTRRNLTRVWHLLRSPKLFAGIIAIVCLEGLLALIVPQQPTTVNTPGAFVVWVSNLPPLFRLQFDLFSRSGLFAIFHSYMFWIPAALAAWMSLLALADLIPAAISRVSSPSIEDDLPTYPNGSTFQETRRLPAPKDSGSATATIPALEEYADTLRSAKFTVTTDDTTVSAFKWRAGWLWPVLLYAAVLLLLFGGGVQTIWGATASSLAIENGGTVQFIGHTIEAAKFVPETNADNTVSRGTFQFKLDGKTHESWPINRWQFWDGWWIFPPKPQPLAKITFSNQDTTENATLIFDDITQALEFSYARTQQSLVVQFTASDGQSDYRIFSRDADGTPIEQAEQNGTAFNLPQTGIEGKVILQNRVLLRAVRLPGLILIICGIIALILAAGLRIFFTPVIIKLKAEVKGRGSRIKIMLETIGNPDKAKQVAEKLFAKNSNAEEKDAS